MGSSNIITDRSGALADHYENTAFGKERYNEGTPAFALSHRFTGQILDEDTGLYYFNARYYDAELGRFIQPDTIVPDPGNPQSLNRYSYCNNNPLAYVDPSGHDVQPVKKPWHPDWFWQGEWWNTTPSAPRRLPPVIVIGNPMDTWDIVGNGSLNRWDYARSSGRGGAGSGRGRDVGGGGRAGRDGGSSNPDFPDSSELPYRIANGNEYAEYYYGQLMSAAWDPFHAFSLPTTTDIDIRENPICGGDIWAFGGLVDMGPDRMGNIGYGFAYARVYGLEVAVAGMVAGEVLYFGGVSGAIGSFRDNLIGIGYAMRV
jgi:RHS repeat-associated protein